MQRLTMLIYFLSLLAPVFSQVTEPDTVIDLGTVTISASRENMFTQGLKISLIGPASLQSPLNRSLGDLLERETATYVKSYGRGSIASISVRGTSANQTGILWNGLNISQPSTGMTDISLVKSVFFEDVAIIYGGSSVIYGSGMIGGAVLLGGPPSFEEQGKVVIGFDMGSFGEKQGLVGVYTGNRRFSSRTVATASGAENDFRYKNLTGETVRLAHAATMDAGFMHDMAFALDEENYIQLGVWYQDAQREVPPTMVMATSDALLADRFIRTMAGWNRSSDRWELQLTGGYFNELETYDEPAADISSRIFNQSAILRFSNRIALAPDHQLLAGLLSRVEIADIDPYLEQRSDWRSSLYASYLVMFPRIDWKGSVGARIVTEPDRPLSALPSLGFDGRIFKHTYLRFNLSRNFRSPTMNERYWEPGGDPELRPEISWNAETGADYRWGSEKTDIIFGVTAYSYYVHDWILWVPYGALWYAENVLEVWSRGLEVSGKQSVDPGSDWSLSFYEAYHFTRSTREKKTSANDAGLGKQLIYTPLHTFSAGVIAGFRNYRLSLDARATGKVYTTTDNSEYLPGYFLADVSLSADYPVWNHGLAITVTAQNIFDEDYVVIRYRPMPGISFMASIRLTINTKRDIK